jgi:SET domain-containing protein
MPLLPSRLIEVKRSRGKGRGVFAREMIPCGTVIERVPVVTLQVQEIFSPVRRSKLAEYVFKWGDGVVAVALGYGSLYNHSYDPNAAFHSDGRFIQVFTAIRDIKAGEEITVNYTGTAKDQSRLNFEVIET